MTQPYPLYWPRNLDFVPLLTLQTALDPRIELTYCEAIVSVPLARISPRAQPIRTGLGGTIKQDDINRRMTKIVYGRPSPTSTALFTQREILGDITSTIQLPEVVLRGRTIKQEVPRPVEEAPSLQGCDHVLSLQIAKGNYTLKLRQMFGLPIRNPFYMIKNELVANRVVGPTDPAFKRMRSVLKTEWTIAPPHGWSDLKDCMLPLQRELCRDRWWQDTGIPHPISGRIDSRLVDAQVFLLDKRQELVAI